MFKVFHLSFILQLNHKIFLKIFLLKCIMIEQCMLLENSTGVTNTKIVCKDGIISSHKILVASTSEFIKNIMRDIPCNDDITLILPDFEQSEMIQILSKVFCNEEEHSDIDKSASIKIGEASNSNDVKADDDDSFTAKVELKNEIAESEEENEDNDQEVKSIKLVNDPVDVHEIISQSSYAEDIIENPKTVKDNNFNENIKNKALFDKAIEGLKTGKFTTLREGFIKNSNINV